jgi:hypothetical protein
MKRINVFLMLLLPILSYGQYWAPVGAKWMYEHDPGLQPYLTIIESVKDTVILDKPCRMLITNEIDEFMRQNGSNYYDTITKSIDFIYDSNDTVFHYDSYTYSFYPLYLLNVKAHDTILIREKVDPCLKNEYFCSRFEYVIDSISNITLQGHNLRLLYNTESEKSEWVFNRSWNFDHYPIIEKLGSLKYFFGVSRNMVMEGGIRCLRCYHDNEISYKADFWSKDCDWPFGSSSSNLKFYNNIEIGPNPFDSHVLIHSNKAVKYELYDLFGKLLITGTDKTIKTDNLESGIYLLRLKTIDNEIKIIKLIKYLP